MNREAGILLPVFSLPGPYGIGCFSKAARRWIDALAAAGQSYWQVLPMGPTGYGDSPYQSFSTFAGNPYFIDLEALCEEGLLTREACAAADLAENPARIDYGRLYRGRLSLLRRAFERERDGLDRNGDYLRFVEENRSWLEDYALFMALKDRHGGAAWNTWEEELRMRRADALDRAHRELAEELRFQRWLQYRFFQQWEDLLRYAHGKGVRMIGDIPIYVAMDSADTWSHPELFRLDSSGVPEAVAGCPPDGFAADGQLWGNPLYRWEVHRETGYNWWMERLRRCFQLCDVLRIDHFRGFDAYYSIPYGAKTAAGGHWEPGPGLCDGQRTPAGPGHRVSRHEDFAVRVRFPGHRFRRGLPAPQLPGKRRGLHGNP